jgi:hypothetical protein
MTDYETVPNKLWLLNATGQAGLGTIVGRMIHSAGSSEEYDGFVIRAPDEPTARLLAPPEPVISYMRPRGCELWVRRTRHR